MASDSHGSAAGYDVKVMLNIEKINLVSICITPSILFAPDLYPSVEEEE